MDFGSSRFLTLTEQEAEPVSSAFSAGNVVGNKGISI